MQSTTGRIPRAKGGMQTGELFLNYLEYVGLIGNDLTELPKRKFKGERFTNVTTMTLSIF